MKLPVRLEMNKVLLSLPISMFQMPCTTVWVVAFSASKCMKPSLLFSKADRRGFQHYAGLTMSSQGKVGLRKAEADLLLLPWL